MFGAVLTLVARARRRSIDQVAASEAAVAAERHRVGWMLDDYRSGRKPDEIGVDLFCYTLDGGVSKFVGFDGQDSGTRTVIQGRDQRAYESAARYIRVHRPNIVVADCLVGEQEPYLHFLLQNLACGIATDRIRGAWLRRGCEQDEGDAVVSVVGADDSLVRKLNSVYGSHGIYAVRGEKDMDFGTGSVDVGLTRYRS